MRFTPAAALVLAAVLYVAPGLSDNPADAAASQSAEGASVEVLAALKALRVEEMSKLVIYDDPQPAPSVKFRDGAGKSIQLADFRGKVTLVNFWATWCPPCRAEMPSIDRLQGRLGGADFEVVAINTDRSGIEKSAPFLKKIGANNLALYDDRRMKLASSVGALGLPMTLILDRSGAIVGRFIGGAKWDSAEAVAVIERLIADHPNPNRSNVDNT